MDPFNQEKTLVDPIRGLPLIVKSSRDLGEPSFAALVRTVTAETVLPT